MARARQRPVTGCQNCTAETLHELARGCPEVGMSERSDLLICNMSWDLLGDNASRASLTRPYQVTGHTSAATELRRP
ncbi:hypothetical protein J6590_106524 [Homalodisca vitripennis]|nr:hypothetical protein J6590_106524 [Homalodisca vitripennis]